MEKWTKYCRCGKYIDHIDKFNYEGNNFFYCWHCKIYFDSEGNNIDFVDKFKISFEEIIAQERAKRDQEFEKKRIEEEKIRQEKQRKLEEEKRIEEKRIMEEKRIEQERQIRISQFKEQILNRTNLNKSYKISDTYYLYKYHPTNISKDGDKIPNPARNHITDFILSIKNCDDNALIKATQELKSRLLNLNNITICIVPPSNALDNISGIKIIAKNLCKNGALDGTECIKRIQTIPKQHSSSDRLSIYELKETLTIEREDLIKDKNILLLDDITTRGNAFESSRELLLEKGARSVICIALGETSYYHNL